MAFGAEPNGVRDNTAAFRAAIAAAQSNAGGGSVWVPAGIYAFTQAHHGPSIQIESGSPGATLPRVTLQGNGAATTILVEHVANKPLLRVEADGSKVKGLTLDARTYGGGTDVTVDANHTTITKDYILGAHRTGVIGSGVDFPFALFFVGPPGASRSNPLYHYDNIVRDSSIVDGINNDGFSFSYQSGGTISNIWHYGSRLALYVDNNVRVLNYTYIPNPECLNSVNGFWIGAPSNNILIDHFTTAGNGGVISGAGEPGSVSNVTIRDERFTSPSGGHLTVANVNGLTINDSSFNSNSTLLLTPNTSATHITIKSTVLGRVKVARFRGSTYSQLSATFNDDTFLALPSGPTFTYPLPAAPGPTAFDIDGGRGTWSPYERLYKQAASNVRFAVRRQVPIAMSPPTISGTAHVGHLLSSSEGGWLAGQTPTPTYTYQWERGKVPIASARTSTFTPTTRGWYQLRVTATNRFGSTNVTSAPFEVP